MAASASANPNSGQSTSVRAMAFVRAWRAADLVQHEPGEQRQDLDRYRVAELVGLLQKLRRFQTKFFRTSGAHSVLLLGIALVFDHPRERAVVRAVLRDENAAFLRQAVDAKAREEEMEQAPVVRVLHVVPVELPVVWG